MIIDDLIQKAKDDLIQIAITPGDTALLLEQAIFLNKLIVCREQLLGRQEEFYDLKQKNNVIEKMTHECFRPALCSLLFKINDGWKIKIIKDFRALTGLGLRESKEIVEKHCANFTSNPHETW